MTTIDVTTIKRAYSGKIGCMCGCMGKYYEHDPAASDQENAKAAKQIRRIVKILNAAPGVLFDADVGCWYLQERSELRRMYVAYVK